ncbi:ATP-binding protein [Thiorhodococcus fuscus]|uniref:ATP-binding protein n=1 Tax=Thiorhodococcus fuscus TaxID=527200 RepID=A0ABW4Y8I8_9GAMM
MSTPDSSLIGRVIDIHSGCLVASIFPADEGFPSSINMGEEALPVGQLGSFVEVRDRAGHLLAEVSRIHEEAVETRSVPDPVASGGSRRVTIRERRLELTPLAEINKDGRLEPGVSRYPVIGAAVHVIGSSRLAALLAREKTGALELGRLSVRPSLKATLDPSALFGRHLAILGQTGAGKSWTLSSLLQRVVSTMPHSHIILLDLHGEYGWKGNDGNFHGIFGPEAARHIDARELEIPYWLLTYSEFVDLFVDRTDFNATVQIAFLRETLFSLRQQSNQHLGLQRLSVDSPVYFSIEDLYQRFKKANEEKLEFGKVKGPLYGAFDDFLVRFQSLYNDARYDFFMRPRKNASSASLEGLLRDFVGLGEPKRQVTVIDLSPVPLDLRPVVSAQIGRLAYEFNYWNPQRHEFPILLVCEEAHQYIPREADTQFVGTRRAMERIAKEGRKYGVTLCIVSQRPTELSETVLSQCGNYLCLKISNADDQEYVRRLLPEGAKNLADLLASLRRGEVLAVGDAAMLPSRILVHPPNPAPASRDAPLSESWVHGPDDLNVGEIVNNWWRQVR